MDDGQWIIRVEAQRAAPPSQCDRIKRQIIQQIYCYIVDCYWIVQNVVLRRSTLRLYCRKVSAMDK